METPESPKTETPEAFDQWALVELFGHQQIVGKVTESTLAGGAFLRVDVPPFDGDKGFTRLYNPKAVYSINPLEEQTARALLAQARFRNKPVQPYELNMLTAGATQTQEEDPLE